MNTADAPNFIRTPQPDHSEIAAKIVSLISFSVLSCLFGMKTFNIQFRYLTYSRWLVLILYLFSWSFTVFSMLLVTTNNETRRNTLSYKINLTLMLPYIGILTLMLIFHISEIDSNGVCTIGLESIAAIPLILINLYMTFFFVRPLLRLENNSIGRDRKRSRLNEVAFRTLVASIVCLIVSFANIFSLQMLNGRERGLVCLTCCTVDVTINVITIHWVTTQNIRKRAIRTDLDYISSLQNRVSNPRNDNVVDIIETDVINCNQYNQKSKVSIDMNQTDCIDSKIENKLDDNLSDISSLHDSRKSLTKK
ncbi:uncharacterized protein BX663DRAFT_530637 [Cokeromyces recurvatus]|uniref:uncharacterized protein n=1 Tax=Cokeromyces recurvatus TaxID=90255 RepID=UPI00221EE220|nr:uncharacterized protein BX663DRAFT_530637 [Cokeromyces recurvatus]KAI7904035.1 hypothetical protein BX663DRAFT_530637 [Cokeromyces recurvatus]